MRKTIVTAMALTLGLSAAVELSCVAGDRGGATSTAPATLFTDAPEPELPMASEFDDPEPSLVLTR